MCETSKGAPLSHLWQVHTEEGPPLQMDGQLRGTEEHEVLFAVLDLYRALLSIVLCVDGLLADSVLFIGS